MTATNTQSGTPFDQTVYDAFVEYIKDNQNRFYLLAYNYVKNRDTALDIVQTAVYKALISMDGLKNPAHIKTWFYRILVNASLDELRKTSKVFPMDPMDMQEDDVNLQGGAHRQKNQALDHADRLDLYAALDKLDPRAKAIINLRFFEDMKLEEIAQVLGESLSSVKARLYRTLSSLKIELDDNWRE